MAKGRAGNKDAYRTGTGNRSEDRYGFRSGSISISRAEARDRSGSGNKDRAGGSRGRGEGYGAGRGEGRGTGHRAGRAEKYREVRGRVREGRRRVIRRGNTSAGKGGAMSIFGRISDYINEEIEVVEERDPAIHSRWEVPLYASFWAVLMYRFAHALYVEKHYFLARAISQIARNLTGIEIHPGAVIGRRFFIDHGSGVVIGETAEIGDNVLLYQGVTLGGTGKEHGKRHPTLEDNVMVSAGAKVLGAFTIGKNSKIGAGSVVLKEVPPDCTVVGVPARVVKRADSEIPCKQLDQVNLPDPVREDIMVLQRADTEITNHILDLEKEVRVLRAEIKASSGNRSRSLSETTGADREVSDII